MRRGQFDPKTEQELFALKPGQVSGPTETPSLYIVYKLESRKIPSLSEVRAEIVNSLYRQKAEILTKAITEGVHIEYNKEYFGQEPTTGWVSAAQAGATSGKKVPAGN